MTDLNSTAWVIILHEVKVIKDAYSMIQESDTWLMIIEEGEDRARRKDIVIVGEARLGPPPEDVHARLAAITDRERLVRILRCAATAKSWLEVLGTR